MKVLHVTEFFDSTLGYAEYYLAKKQVEFGLDVKVACSNYSIRLARALQPGSTIENNIPVVRLNTACKFRGNFWVFNPISLAETVKEFSPNVVYCRGLLSPLSQEILLLKRKYDYSIVGDLITGIGTDTFSRIAEVCLTQGIRHFLRYWLSNEVDAFLACNKAIESWLRNSLKIPSSKIFFVPLGADHRLFKPDSRERAETRAFLGISPDDIVAIYTGKFVPSKRVHDLLAASKAVINRYENLKILLVGDGPASYKERLKLLMGRLGISRNVFTVKTVHRTKLRRLYNAADFAIWPGTFSISIIEAMACGLPVIIAKSNWTSHYLEYKNGFSFRAGDLTTLISLLSKLIQDNELRRFMREQSRRLVEDKLNWDNITKQHVEIYRSVLPT